ncbi:MAG: hypothetical protein FD137_2203 [Spirochaetes bacterium]|nr:MAG: hypothetical protein FD137_2203 [Spirochaetota bacterium]
MDAASFSGSLRSFSAASTQRSARRPMSGEDNSPITPRERKIRIALVESAELRISAISPGKAESWFFSGVKQIMAQPIPRIKTKAGAIIVRRFLFTNPLREVTYGHAPERMRAQWAKRCMQVLASSKALWDFPASMPRAKANLPKEWEICPGNAMRVSARVSTISPFQVPPLPRFNSWRRNPRSNMALWATNTFPLVMDKMCGAR